jgi:hypothetical protein
MAAFGDAVGYGMSPLMALSRPMVNQSDRPMLEEKQTRFARSGISDTDPSRTAGAGLPDARYDPR